MEMKAVRWGGVKALICAVLLLGLGACADLPDLPMAAGVSDQEAPAYRIGPGDTLRIFVWVLRTKSPTPRRCGFIGNNWRRRA